MTPKELENIKHSTEHAVMPSMLIVQKLITALEAAWATTRLATKQATIKEYISALEAPCATEAIKCDYENACKPGREDETRCVTHGNWIDTCNDIRALLTALKKENHRYYQALLYRIAEYEEFLSPLK